MESLHTSGRARLLGVSNVNRQQLELLWDKATVKPSFVQNRCFAVLGWDRDVRQFCTEAGIAYQGFSLLTANREAVLHPHVAAIGQRHGRPVTQIIFRFALDVGMIPLTGTTNPAHMRSDLEAFDFHLTPEEVVHIETMFDRS